MNHEPYKLSFLHADPQRLESQLEPFGVWFNKPSGKYEVLRGRVIGYVQHSVSVVESFCKDNEIDVRITT